MAYIDEVEVTSQDKSKKSNQKVYYSALVKAASPKSIDSSEPVQNLDEVNHTSAKAILDSHYNILYVSYCCLEMFSFHLFSWLLVVFIALLQLDHPARTLQALLS